MVHYGRGAPVSGDAGLHGDAGRTEEDPGSPYCPLSCTGPDSSSGSCRQIQTRPRGQWSRRYDKGEAEGNLNLCHGQIIKALNVAVLTQPFQIRLQLTVAC